MLEITGPEDGKVTISGRFDASQVGKVQQVLESVEGSVVADLSRLDYISSAGIGVILMTYKRLRESGATLKLVNLRQSIRNIFQISGLDTILDIE